MAASANKIEQLKFFLEKEPEDTFLNYALALEYLKIGLDVEAQSLLNNILKIDEEYLGAYYQLGKLLGQNEQYNEAVQWYKKGMRVAQQLKDVKAYNELRSALEEISED